MEVNKPTPQDPMYSSNFKHGVDLFEKSFKEREASQLEAQRSQYLKVMKESLHIMQDAASGMLNDHLLSLKETLDQDLNAYVNDPTEEHRNKVEKDIQELKKNE